MADSIEDDEEESGGGWLVSYADLMTLLFATFVVLYGIKPEGETTAILGLVSSVREAFIEVPDDIDPKAKTGPTIKGKKVFKFWKEVHQNSRQIKVKNRHEELQNVLNKDLSKIKDVVEFIEKKNFRETNLDKSHILKVFRKDGEISISLAASYFYAPGKYRLNYKKLETLEPLVSVLKSMKRNIVIEGHTDSTRPRGMSNWELSALRASYFMHYLIDDYSFPVDRVDSRGFAAERPLYSEKSPEGRKGNRRIEIKVRYEESVQ